MKLAALLIAVAAALAAPARATTHTLDLTRAGVPGASVVTSTPSGIVCPGTCSATFYSTVTVTLGEVAESSVAFAGWSGVLCPHNFPTCKVAMTADHSVTANFNPVLKLRLNGNGLGVVTSTGNAVACDWTNGCANSSTQTYSLPPGATIVLTESTGTASNFVAWSGNPNCGSASTCTIVMNGLQVIVATFTSNGPFTLKVNVVGGGSVRSTPAGILCPSSTCAAPFAANTSVTLATQAAAGYAFGGWANGGCASSSTVCVVKTTTTLQGLGGLYSPSAFFYKMSP